MSKDDARRALEKLDADTWDDGQRAVSTTYHPRVEAALSSEFSNVLRQATGYLVEGTDNGRGLVASADELRATLLTDGAYSDEEVRKIVTEAYTEAHEKLDETIVSDFLRRGQND